MPKRNISDLELKIKFTKEFLENGGIKRIPDIDLLEDLEQVRTGPDGQIDTDSISPRVNAFMRGILVSHQLPPVFVTGHISFYSSLLQKTNNFDQINIDTTEKFDEIYENFKLKDNILFRGQREAKWRLYSKLQRHWTLDNLFRKSKSYKTVIKRLIEFGKIKYEKQIKEILKSHNIDCINSVSILSFLQHHSCPTPLLDWTYKFQNALYFGIDDLQPSTTTIEIDNYFSIYYIEERHFEDGNMRSIIDNGLSEIEKPLLLEEIAKIAKDEKTRIEMEDHFKGRKLFDRQKITGSGLIEHMTRIDSLIGFPIAYFSDKDKESGILFSLNNSKNILNQIGVFTWNSDPFKPLELLGEEQFLSDKKDADVNYKFCSCFNINKNLYNHVKQKLDADGITKEFIYPTKDLNAWSIFELAIKEEDKYYLKRITNKYRKSKSIKKRKKGKKRTNLQIVEYWQKKRHKMKKHILRKK